MIQLFTHQDFTRVGFYESVLKEAGIRCFVQNASTQNYLGAVMGGLVGGILSASLHSTLPMFLPQLWIIDDDDFDAAIELLKPFHDPAPPDMLLAEDWKCPQCGESVPAGFESCWQCGAVMEGAPES